MRRTIFLDRDNTIIHNDGHLGDPEAVHLMAGAAQAMVQLVDAGFSLIVVTNQSGVARGLFTEEDVKAVHRSIDRSIAQATGREDLVLGWYYSPWHPEAVIDAYRGNHPTRKPEPGMLLEAADDHELTPASRLVSARAAARQGMSTRWGCVEASSSSHYLLHTVLADGLVQFNLTCPCWI